MTEVQARAILDLRLQRLTQIGVKEVTDELEELAAKIKEYLEILGSRDRIMGIISDELREVKDQFAVPRRTEIVDWARWSSADREVASQILAGRESEALRRTN